jgi:hypothetical protein
MDRKFVCVLVRINLGIGWVREGGIKVGGFRVRFIFFDFWVQV